MTTTSIALAKLAGIHKALSGTIGPDGPLRPIQSFKKTAVQHYFDGANAQLVILKEAAPELFADFVMATPEPNAISGLEENVPLYMREKVRRLINDIDQILEIRANSELTLTVSTSQKLGRVFISHGRSGDWREVQAFLERDLGLATLELAQEPNQGMTVIQKLSAAADQCDSAVIVMTGDDIDADGVAKARENVMHEIGYFQGRYGPSRVCLLHEEGVNIPSNMQGLVYSAFPKEAVHACFGLLTREMKAFYK
ncbi:putative nucleotide-binding protein containing TIR-like domain containing protein [Herbaspirillum sp. CF444]|uniref:TIR domain-containing protein n=1 Tax=Herbaspirillum sp. CF444 TaxID=1144319 RepID=UPI000272577D|nr:nucleotide-binding protein [Herbaspirillum sp. CF444]EJL92739.1 putative nucleotide-binding protein containing TIR-like domain containing protein [Herbaspirillum sp. CF444]